MIVKKIRLHAFNIITARYDDDLPICRIRERYRKQMRRRSKVLYDQRIKPSFP
jgi:hypothetical protein